MFPNDEYLTTTTSPATNYHHHLSLSTRGDVAYSCGACGYELNLSSCNRNTTNINSKYGKAIKRGVMSFFTIDESRFTQKDEVSCKPYFNSKSSWGLFRRRTKLLCRKCGNHIGNAYDDSDSPGGSQNVDFISGNGGACKNYSVKISALQPSDESGTSLVMR